MPIVSNQPDLSTLGRYNCVQLVPTEKINVAPENDEIYGTITHDEQMQALVDSIRHRGLEDPLILTEDYYVISGHRRFFACRQLGMWFIPCRVKTDIVWEHEHEFHKVLVEYNPQRIKSAGSLIKEALLKMSDTDDTSLLTQRHNRKTAKVKAKFNPVIGTKIVSDVSDKKQEFLEAAKKVITDLFEFWPLSIRQIHYRLPNDPPLTLNPKRSKFDLEHYRYANTRASYNLLVNLLVEARYNNHVEFGCIDDPTRPDISFSGFTNASQFIHQEVDNFLWGYHRDKQLEQTRYVHVHVEKNTIVGIVKPVCEEYGVSLTCGRGYCSHSIWHKIATRFNSADYDSMTLILLSDYDPEGLDLGDDAVRSLRDLWELPVDYHRVALNREQIDELNLSEDFNPCAPSPGRVA